MTTRNIGSSPLRNVFALALLAGFLGIVTGWIAESGGLSTISMILTIGVPISAMLGYWYFAFQRDPTALATELFADSMYYLGFLLTLVALVVSLMGFTTNTTDTSGVVYRFAVALITTVLGLGIRIWLVNFRLQPADEVGAIQNQIIRSAQTLRDGLDQLSRGVVLQHNEFKASIDRVIKNLDSASSQLAPLSERFKRAADQSAASFSGTIDSVRQTLGEAASDAASDAADASAALSTVIAEATSELSKAATSSVSAFADQIRSTGADLDAAGAALKARLAREPLPADMFVAQLQPAIAALRSHLEDQHSQIATWLASNKEMSEDIGDLNRSLSAAVNSAQRLAGISVTSSGRAQSALADLADELEGIMRPVRELSSESKTVIEAHLGTVANMEAEIARQLKSARQHRAELDGQLSSAREASNQVHAEMVEAARFVRDQLSQP